MKVREIKMAGAKSERFFSEEEREFYVGRETKKRKKLVRSSLGVQWDLDARADATTSFVPTSF